MKRRKGRKWHNAKEETPDSMWLDYVLIYEAKDCEYGYQYAITGWHPISGWDVDGLKGGCHEVLFWRPLPWLTRALVMDLQLTHRSRERRKSK